MTATLVRVEVQDSPCETGVSSTSSSIAKAYSARQEYESEGDMLALSLITGFS